MVKVSELSTGQLFIYRHKDGSCCICQYLGQEFGRSVVCGLRNDSSFRFIESDTLVFTSIKSLEYYLLGDFYYDTIEEDEEE